MKLNIGDIRFSGGESGYASATATVDTGTLPFLIFSICRMDVSVPLVEGKSLEQYERELTDKAKARITEIYKEIVCGGEPGEASSLNSNHDLEERVTALEKRLDEQGSPDMVKVIYEASKKAAEDFLNQQEKSPGEEVLVGITENCHVSGSISSVGLPFCITDECGKLFVHDKGEISTPTHRHRDAIIDRVIHDLKQGNGNMLKLLGRCMGLLQVAAEIEAVSQMCASECERCRESILSDFDNPPFKNAPIGWISPGVKYLKRRI
ncbi:hypothetical protein DPU24_26960 [Salmonella enterica subsp. enterica serovar Oranienburg]|nr:hypothetical protein [Salmonella enterica subsp. enterica serovar Oranienburg]